MEEIDDILNFALQEAENKTLPITQQYLSEHNIVDEEGRIECAPEKLTENVWAVHFSIIGKLYNLVIPVHREESGLRLGIPYIEPYTKIYIKLCSPKLSYQSISNLIGLEPTKYEVIHPVGEEEESVWYYEFDKTIQGSLVKKLKIFIQELSLFKDAIAQFTLEPDSTGYITIDYVGYRDQAWGIYLDRTIIEFLHETRLEFDIDILHLEK